ncbi:membrane-spanning 4-domains subfamily A member 7 [Rhinolophus ferrumequinum]|uniref:Membrane spanning 4-domains A7 n=1 Tax=Rhinolophus ferrumequinum TaxID=59479 RepID=A0A671DR43_RHIFE|nr:membrane-spanning 4-domains subfamily A member 7 [Rhinolophus ferrumequinum]
MLSQPKTKKAFQSSTPKGIIIPPKEKPGHIDQKEDELQNEATILGTVQILCCLMISSLGIVLVFAPYSSHFNPSVSTILMSGYPFVGALCFAITGYLSIISGKKSTKPFAISSLSSSAVSFVAAGAGLFLLTASLVALGTATQLCDSEKEHLSSIHEVKDCLLTRVSLIGVLVVMLTFTVLELLIVAYASVFWWKQVYSNNPSTFSLLQSQDLIEHVKKILQGHEYERHLAVEEKGGESPVLMVKCY